MAQEDTTVRVAKIQCRKAVGKFKSSFPNKSDPVWYVVALSTTLFVCFTIYLSLLYQGYTLTGGDFGNYLNMFSEMRAGNGLLPTGRYKIMGIGAPYWGQHFSVTLLGLYLVYALVPSAYTLIVMKSFFLAISILMLWRVAREELADIRLAGFVTASYALNPFLWSAWLFDFQEQILLPVLVFAAYYCYKNQRYVVFLALYLLVLLTNEFMVIVCTGFLLGLLVSGYRNDELREVLPPLGVAGVLSVTVYVISGWVVSQFSPVQGIPARVIATPFQPFIEAERVSITTLVSAVLSHPTVLFDALSVGLVDKVIYLALFFLPVAFLAYDEVTLGALAPYLGFAWVFAGTSFYYTFELHYPLYVIAFVYIGAIRVLRRMQMTESSLGIAAGKQWISRPESGFPVRNKPLFRVFSCILVLNVVIGVGMVAGNGPVPHSQDHTQVIDKAITTIPENASLLTQNDIYPHVASRPKATFTTNPNKFRAYERKYGPVTPEYVLVDTHIETHGYQWSSSIFEVFLHDLQTEYGLVRYSSGVWVFKRGYHGPVKGVFDSDYSVQRRYKVSQFVVTAGYKSGGKIVGASKRPERIWYGPYTILPPGNYTVTFRVNVSSGDASAFVLDVAVSEDHRTVAKEVVNATDGWETVTVRFHLSEFKTNVEFRGKATGGNGTVRLDWVVVSTRT